MCVDFNIHDPNGEQKNVHAHIMLTMRPISQDGTWVDKQKKEYILTPDGNKIYDPKKRQYKCNIIPTTDRNEHTKAEEWRQTWADCANEYLAKNNSPERIDHRSYDRQGVEQIPTVHMGVAATQMEKKGIATEKGNLNRKIQEDNRLIKMLKEKIAALGKWLTDILSSKESDKPSEPTLLELLVQSQSSSQKSGVTNLKSYASAFAYIETHEISTFKQLDEHLKSIRNKTYWISGRIKKYDRRKSELKELLEASSVYSETRKVYEKYRQQGKNKEAFYDNHTAGIIRHEAAKRKLDKLLPERKLHTSEWKIEYAQLSEKYDADYAELLRVREDVNQAENVRKQVERVLPSIQKHTKNHDMER